MAEKKKSADLHKSRFVIRLPEEFRPLFEAARKKNRRPYSEETRIALEKHFAEMGLWPPNGDGSPS